MNSEPAKPLQQTETNPADSNQMATQAQPIDPATAKRNKRGFALLMIAAGVFLLWMNWNSALSSGTYWPMASVLAPTVIGIGCSVLLFPQNKNHNALGVVGFLLGIVNWLFISGTL
jgi:fatty acid desaturase